ncbi:hypothetical protein CIC12_12890 [Burkholderia sp. SG-MS1]|nr:hypothetical protein [Paraburkholderia sp. SG-MS1]
MRSLPQSGIESTNSHIAVIRVLLIFVRWCIRQGKQLAVETEGFSRIDTSVIQRFLKAYSEEGVLGVMQFHKKIIHEAGEAAFLDSSESNLKKQLYALPEEVKNRVCGWLESKKLYSSNGYGRAGRAVNRRKLAEILQTDTSYLQGDRFMSFLRQFEPQLEEAFPGLCVTSELRTEYPSHRTLSIEDAKEAKPTASRMTAILNALRSLFALHKHFPEQLPPSEAINFSFSRFVRQATANKHTPWMPLEQALNFLCEAVHWVLDLGHTVIRFFLVALQEFRERGWLEITGTDGEVYYEKRNQWITANLPEQLSSLNICGWSNRRWEITDYSQLRNSPTLVDVVRVLIGACTTVAAALKPIRIDELENLPRSCISHAEGDGYWITHHRGKDTEELVYSKTDAPIPLVLARAIDLLGQLGEGAYRLCETSEPWDANSLYFLPDFSCVEIRIKKMGSRYVHSSMDLFADYINLPVDSMGRRWYPRIHEHRKSFLITFVWSFRFAAIDAARQLVGHSDEKYMRAYLESNFPDESMPSSQAQYLASLLWNFQASHGRESGATDLDQLYKSVRRRFKVKDISELKENDLEQWIELQLLKKRIEMVPYFISVGDNFNKRFAVTVVMRPKGGLDEQGP